MKLDGGSGGGKAVLAGAPHHQEINKVQSRRRRDSKVRSSISKRRQRMKERKCSRFRIKRPNKGE